EQVSQKPDEPLPVMESEKKQVLASLGFFVQEKIQEQGHHQEERLDELEGPARKIETPWGNDRVECLFLCSLPASQDSAESLQLLQKMIGAMELNSYRLLHDFEMEAPSSE